MGATSANERYCSRRRRSSSPSPDEALEGDPQAAVLLLAGAEDGRHERRLDLLGDVRFAIEARDQIRVLGGTFVEDFEGDLLAASALRSVHLAHPTLADQPADLVDPADYRSWRQARLGCHIPVERSTASPAHDKPWLRLGHQKRARGARIPESTARSAVEQRREPLYARLPALGDTSLGRRARVVSFLARPQIRPASRSAPVPETHTSPMRSVQDVEAYLGKMNRRFSHVDDSASTFLVHGGGNMPPTVLRVDPPLVVLRVHVGDIDGDASHNGELYQKLLTINAKSLVHISFGLEDGQDRPLQRARAREPRLQRARRRARRDRRHPRAAGREARRALEGLPLVTSKESLIMGIFSRLAQLIKSNLNDLISKSEDPEKMLNQIVLDMNNQLVEAKKQVASSIADEKRLAKQFEQEMANAAEWERRAMMALRAGNEELAKEALARKKEHDQLAETFKDQWHEAEERGRSAEEGSSDAERQDRGGEAEEERPHRAQEARRGAEGDPGDHERSQGSERLRDVRPHGRQDRSARGRGRGRGASCRGVHGRRARLEVPEPRARAPAPTRSSPRSSARWACSLPRRPAGPRRDAEARRGAAPARRPPAASRNEQDELAAALEEMEAEQNQEQQRKAGR